MAAKVSARKSSLVGQKIAYSFEVMRDRGARLGFSLIGRLAWVYLVLRIKNRLDPVEMTFH